MRRSHTPAATTETARPAACTTRASRVYEPSGLTTTGAPGVPVTAAATSAAVSSSHAAPSSGGSRRRCGCRAAQARTGMASCLEHGDEGGLVRRGPPGAAAGLQAGRQPPDHGHDRRHREHPRQPAQPRSAEHLDQRAQQPRQHHRRGHRHREQGRSRGDLGQQPPVEGEQQREAERGGQSGDEQHPAGAGAGAGPVRTATRRPPPGGTTARSARPRHGVPGRSRAVRPPPRAYGRRDLVSVHGCPRRSPCLDSGRLPSRVILPLRPYSPSQEAGATLCATGPASVRVEPAATGEVDADAGGDLLGGHRRAVQVAGDEHEGARRRPAARAARAPGRRGWRAAAW